MNSKWNFNPMNIFGLVVALMFIAGGIYLLAVPKIYNAPNEVRIIFGIFMLAYGIFRGASIFFKLKNPES